MTQHRTLHFYESTPGKKAVMAVSGVILFGFVLGHLAGNLQVYEGPEKINAYAQFLRSIPAALWGARITLLGMVVLHVWSSISLGIRKLHARPLGYVKKASIASTYASRTMYWSGPIITAFIIYHLLHFTFGVVHPNFQEADVYANVVNGFKVIPVSAFYIFAMLLLGMHLQHGLWSMFQTLGFSHPRYTPWLRHLATALSVLIVLGNISIPIAVMAGWVS